MAKEVHDGCCQVVGVRRNNIINFTSMPAIGFTGSGYPVSSRLHPPSTCRNPATHSSHHICSQLIIGSAWITISCKFSDVSFRNGTPNFGPDLGKSLIGDMWVIFLTEKSQCLSMTEKMVTESVRQGSPGRSHKKPTDLLGQTSLSI
jgi:hypothetical protein